MSEENLKHRLQAIEWKMREAEQGVKALFACEELRSLAWGNEVTIKLTLTGSDSPTCRVAISVNDKEIGVGYDDEFEQAVIEALEAQP